MGNRERSLADCRQISGSGRSWGPATPERSTWGWCQRPLESGVISGRSGQLGSPGCPRCQLVRASTRGAVFYFPDFTCQGNLTRSLTGTQKREPWAHPHPDSPGPGAWQKGQLCAAGKAEAAAAREGAGLACRRGALSRPLGRTEWRQDNSWGSLKVWTGKGMGVDTPEGTPSATDWHRLQTYNKQTVLERRSWPRGFAVCEK